MDFYLREDDAPRAHEALETIGMKLSTPPEGWLLKAHDDEILVDLIYRPAGGPIGDDHFERATPMELMAQPVLVASIDDVLTTKLMALTEQEPDFRSVLELARSLREQIDWDFVRARTESSPFAAAFFTLVEALGIAPAAERRRRARADRRQVWSLHTPGNHPPVSDSPPPDDTGPDDATRVDRRVRRTERDVEVERGHDVGQPAIPDELVPPAPVGTIEEPVGPRVVTENERVTIEDDGSVSRQRRRGWSTSRRDGAADARPGAADHPRARARCDRGRVVLHAIRHRDGAERRGLPLDAAVSRVQDDGFKTDITSEPNDAAEGTVFRQSPGGGSSSRQGLDRAAVRLQGSRAGDGARTRSASARRMHAIASRPSG